MGEEIKLRSGGPRTDAGKAHARGNATVHGLSGTTLLPPGLSPNSLAELALQLAAEWRPTTPTQEILLAEIARHAELLKFTEIAEPAVIRHGLRAAMHQLPGDDPGGAPSHDAQIATAATTDALALMARYRRGHEKALVRSLDTLRELQSLQQIDLVVALTESFASEALCRAYLVSRTDRQLHDRAHEDARRASVDLRPWRVSRQEAARRGTVFARSRLPLTLWFRAVAQLLVEPEISPAVFSSKYGVKRLATVRTLLKRVRWALAQDNAEELLAGLPTWFAKKLQSGALPSNARG